MDIGQLNSDEGHEVDGQAQFKAVFLTEQGQWVFARILEKLKFLEPCENERDMALNNFAKDLVATVFWNKKKQQADTRKIFGFIKKMLRRTR